MIDHLYDECFKESIILGIYMDGRFCGIAELYGYKDEYHKVSPGRRSNDGELSGAFVFMCAAVISYLP